MKIKKNTLLMLILTFCTMNLIFLGDLFSQNVQAKKQNPIQIGVILPLSGSSEYFGKSCLIGIAMAADEINKRGGLKNRNINLLIRDDQANPQIAKKAALELIDKNKCVLIIGSGNSDCTQAIKDISITKKIPQITPISSATELTTDLNNWFYRMSYSDRSLLSLLLGFLSKVSFRLMGKSPPFRVVILYEESKWGKGLLNDTYYILQKQKLPIKIVKAISIKRDSTDSVIQAIDTIKKKHPSTDSVGLYVLGEEIKAIIKEMHSTKCPGLEAVFSTDAASAAVISELGHLANGMMVFSTFFPSDPRANIRPFLTKYSDYIHNNRTIADKINTNEFGNIPDSFAAQGYDTVTAISKAIERTSSITPENIHSELRKLELKGVTGGISFDNKGERKDFDVFFLVAKDGKLIPEELVEDSEVKNNWPWFVIRVLALHFLLWLLLIIAYPRSRMVQAIFFWNPWVRSFLGIGYVSFMLTWVPFLRKILFTPFRASLLADAAIGNIDSEIYFERSEVIKHAINIDISPKNPQRMLLASAIPEIKGQIVLIGASGLGKTMFLRRLVLKTRRLMVYIKAEKCAHGVSEAIQSKLYGPAKHSKFLRNLIFSGALDICIDGLNEVNVETRARINEFVESYFTGNILIATQPLNDWKPPSGARIFELLPLTKENIFEFLRLQGKILKKESEALIEYKEMCNEFLNQVFNPKQPKAMIDGAYRILSNPMDLTIVSFMLYSGYNYPNLFGLMSELYAIMASKYKKTFPTKEFPLLKFSEVVYQRWCKDNRELPMEDFSDEIECMYKHKMVVVRHIKKLELDHKVWLFRHEKIAEFFITKAFLNSKEERFKKHLSDSRFRGVYLLFSITLPLKEAENLRDMLVEYGADHNDHTISDSFVKLLRARKDHEVSI